MEDEEEEVLTGVSAEDKSRRPQAKGPSEPVHPGEMGREGEKAGRSGQHSGRGGGWGQAWPFFSLEPPR